MKGKRTFGLLLVSLLLFMASNVMASEWTNVVKLDGLWKFSVGDNAEWSKPTFDDTEWDKINVPDEWETFFDGYNGYAWYRTSFNMKWIPEEGLVSMFLGYIDDVDEVFLNGVKIGQMGSFPPNFKTCYNLERRYKIPNGLLKPSNNVLAVRVYDQGLAGGITVRPNVGPTGIYLDNDAALMSVDLTGKWKFSVYRQSRMMEKSFDDSKWEDIQVPATWESQGYPDHDGIAWYRTKFKVPANLVNQNLYLVLGKIDELDKVYLNGNLVARTENLEVFNRLYKGNTQNFYRVYPLPKTAIQTENVLVVEVEGGWGNGGIYDGPIGIATYEDARVILDRNKNNQVDDNPIESLIRLIFN